MYDVSICFYVFSRCFSTTVVRSFSVSVSTHIVYLFISVYFDGLRMHLFSKTKTVRCHLALIQLVKLLPCCLKQVCYQHLQLSAKHRYFLPRKLPQNSHPSLELPAFDSSFNHFPDWTEEWEPSERIQYNSVFVRAIEMDSDVDWDVSFHSIILKPKEIAYIIQLYLIVFRVEGPCYPIVRVHFWGEALFLTSCSTGPRDFPSRPPPGPRMSMTKEKKILKRLGLVVGCNASNFFTAVFA